MQDRIGSLIVKKLAKKYKMSEKEIEMIVDSQFSLLNLIIKNNEEDVGITFHLRFIGRFQGSNLRKSKVEENLKKKSKNENTN